MGLLNLLVKDPVAFALLAVPLLYSIILHELAHGWVADRMGDPTARLLGRLSLDPRKHLDPVGTIMLFLFGFGWAKPVPVNLDRLRDRPLGIMFVSSAGIAANTLLAFAAFFLYRLMSPTPGGVPATFLFYLAQINVILAAFNLIPIPPLDGSKIFMGFTSEKFQHFLSRIEPYGFFILIGLLYLGILDPLIAFFRWIILSIIGLLLGS
jgi:Zn-dependent protease